MSDVGLTDNHLVVLKMLSRDEEKYNSLSLVKKFGFYYFVSGGEIVWEMVGRMSITMKQKAHKTHAD